VGPGAPGGRDLDAHRDDPEFGYRFLLDQARDAGAAMAERTAWRICSDNGWWSRFGKKKRYAKARVAAPAHDDLVRREFTAPGPNQIWLCDLTEHPTREGKVYLCAIKDVWSRRIVGYSISDRMQSSIAVAALDSAVARRAVTGQNAAGCVFHSDRGSQGGFNWSSQHLDLEVLDGASSAGSGSGGASEASVTGSSEVSTSGRGGVLGADRQGSSS
jgi:transposase InsO family protein